MKRFDVIVINGGPSGAISGYTYGKAGLAMLPTEKTSFPRLVKSFLGLNVHVLRTSPSLQRRVSDLLCGHRSYQGICAVMRSKRDFPN